MNKRRKAVISTAVILLLMSVFAIAASLYPAAKVTFSGVEVVTNTNSGTTQGFVDITLRKVNATGVSFCLKYDKNYLELSNVGTNAEIKDNPPDIVLPGMDPIGAYDLNHEWFELSDNFNADSFIDNPNIAFATPKSPVIGVADAEAGYIAMNFLPDSADGCDYIEMNTERDKLEIKANTTEGVKLGRISFSIKNPAEFSKLTADDLKNIIKVVPFTDMDKTDTLGGDEDINGVYMSYIDDEGKIRFYNDSDNKIEYEFDVNVKISDIKADISEMTVNSYEIYKNGGVSDLLDFINEKMNALTVTYADGSRVPAMMEWKSESVSSITWDAKGGTYTISQRYNDEIDPVEITVKVLPVTLTGFDVENPNETYLYTGTSADDTDFPQKYDDDILPDFNMPWQVRPVLDTYLPDGGIPMVDVSYYVLKGTSYGASDLPWGSGTPTAGTYEYSGKTMYSAVDFGTNYPWLTVPTTLPEIKVVRTVVTDIADMPKELEVVSAETDDNGVLTIVVKNADGSAIPNGTDFTIKMPGGEVIDSGKYTVTIADGNAMITVTPTDNEKLARVINLGSRAGEFAIASTEPGKSTGKYTNFSPDPRKNKYLPSESGGDYEFDYSGSDAKLFPVKAGSTIPTTLRLPIAEHRIATTYNGNDGYVEGTLETFTVDSWDIVDGDPSVAGSVVTVRGTLANTSYTNYGNVVNEDGRRVVIKYLVAENDGEDQIDAIPDFEFDKQQEGYDYDDLQTKTFVIKNSGTTDIDGLTAEISVTDETGGEAFAMTKQLPKILPSGKSAELDITTKIGLPSGTYTSTVSIISDNKVLQTFKIKFTVVEEPVYKIEIKVNDEDLGSADTSDGMTTSEKDEVITIVAEPKEDCIFVGWTVDGIDDASDLLTDPTAETTTFVMPENDVTITANFKEGLGAKLRATELYVKDADTADTSTSVNYDLHEIDESGTWSKVEFDPIKREYYVAVPNETDDVKLWFKLREEAKDATIKLTHTHDSAVDTIATTFDSDDSFNKSDAIPLDVSPTDNLLELSLTASNEEEGEVTRTYTIHVYRKLAKSSLMTFNYGNSPYGLIMRDNAISDKTKAMTDFVDNSYTFTDTAGVPSGAESGTRYSPKAWKATNYDLDTIALFVINSKPFTDSAYTSDGTVASGKGYSSLKNSIGVEVADSDVTKSIEVTVLTESDTAKQNGSSEDFVTIAKETVNLPSTGKITELMGKRIRPDVYELKYTFTDFDGSTMSVTKPIIILSEVGDVNVSGAADSTDISRIKNRFNVDIANEENANVTGVSDYAVGGKLFRFRVCDTNCDENFNLIDANFIRANKAKTFYKNIIEGTDITEGGGD